MLLFFSSNFFSVFLFFIYLFLNETLLILFFISPYHTKINHQMQIMIISWQFHVNIVKTKRLAIGLSTLSWTKCSPTIVCIRIAELIKDTMLIIVYRRRAFRLHKIHRPNIKTQFPFNIY